MSAFEEFGIMPELIASVQKMDWQLPRDIQAECIPLILGGGDVMAAAETGSGKTGAFGLPLLQVVHETLKEASNPVKINKSEKETANNNAFTWNASDRDASVAISADGLTIQSRTQSWAGVRATVAVSKGLYYYEITVNDKGGCRFGWASRAAKLDLGTDNHGFGYGFAGKKSNNKQFTDYGEPFSEGDVIGCYLNCKDWTIHYSKNGKLFDTAFQIPASLQKASFHPAVCLKNAEVTANFGETPFKYEPKNGFIALQQADPAHITVGGIERVSKKGRAPLALILEPTHELAIQTHNVIGSFKEFLPSPGVDQLLLVGGQNNSQEQTKTLQQQGVDIITATPGRLLELLENGSIDLRSIRFFVLDEADQLISQNFTGIMKVFDSIPKSPLLQVLLFSATLHSQQVRSLGEKICRFPTWVDLKGKDSVPETVDYGYVLVNPKENNEWVHPNPKVQTDKIHVHDNIKPNANTPESWSQAIKVLKPIILRKVIDAFQMEQALIFCRTKVDCDHLESYLLACSSSQKKGGKSMLEEYSCACLHSDKTAPERRANIQKFKDGDIRFLICTDVAARGIDISGLPYMINFTLPDNAEDFIHRVGRVGRAERMGLAISLVASQEEKVWFHTCPSRGKKCDNTKLKEQGGCAIWYTEQQYFQEIQKRLDTTIPHLDSNYQLSSGVVYGQKRQAATVESDLFLQHIEQIQPLIHDLSDLEESSQRTFWSLKTRWN